MVKVGEFSRKSGLSVDTVRYYEKLGLLKPDRSRSRVKNYSEADLEQVKTIIALKKFNLSLQDIQKMFELDSRYDDKSITEAEKLDVITELKCILDKAYAEVLTTEKQIKITKAKLEKSINKVNKSLENGGKLI